MLNGTFQRSFDDEEEALLRDQDPLGDGMEMEEGEVPLDENRQQPFRIPKIVEFVNAVDEAPEPPEVRLRIHYFHFTRFRG